MQQNLFDTEFAAQFQRLPLNYPGFAQEQHQHLLVRRFSGHWNELSVLGTKLIRSTTEIEEIASVVSQLRLTTIPQSIRLQSLVQAMQKVFYSFVMQAPRCSGRLHELLETLCPFQALIKSVHSKLDHLLQKCSDLFLPIAIVKKDCIRSEIDDMIFAIGIMTYDVNLHYHYYYSCLDREAEDSRAVELGLPVEFYLMQLVSYTENLLLALDDMQSQSESWRTQVCRLQTLALNN